MLENTDIKPVTTEKRTKVSYNNIFSENLLAIEMRITQILMNNPVSLGLSVLELSKIAIYEFCVIM